MGGGIQGIQLVAGAATVLLTVLTLVVIAWRRWRARRRYPHPTCPRCRYAAIGLSWTVCPECGNDVETSGVIPARAVKPWPVGVRAAVWIVLVVGAWLFILFPLAERIPPGREIRDWYVFQQPVSGAYRAVEMSAQTFTWPHTRPDPDGEWTLNLRVDDEAVHRRRIRSNSPEDDAGRIAAWIAGAIGLDAPTDELLAEGEAIAARLKEPGADRGAADFGTANDRWMGALGSSRPFLGIVRRHSVVPKHVNWPRPVVTAVTALIGVVGLIRIAVAHRCHRRERASAWRAIRPDEHGDGDDASAVRRPMRGRTGDAST